MPPRAEDLADSELSASDLAGKSKTVIISAEGGKGILLEEIEVVVTGRTAWTVSAYYTGFGANDTGEEYPAS